MWSWQNAQDAFPLILQGLKFTVIATVFGAIVAYVLGLIFALLRRSSIKAVRTVVYWIVEFVRTTPLLVQLFFLFFVLPDFGLKFDPLTTGIVGLGIHYAAYTSEVYRAGIEGVPPGQWEACRALSLPGRRTWTGVVLPQAVPKVLPALGNYTIAMFKETPLLSAIGVTEMVSEADGFAAVHFASLEAFTIVGLLFLVLSIAAALLVQLMERLLAKQHA